VIDSKDQSVITQVFKSFETENEALVKSITQIGYYFRGALTRDDVWAMSPMERESAVEFLNDRFKEVNDLIKKQIPVFW
jgi:hypothetical protein